MNLFASLAALIGIEIHSITERAKNAAILYALTVVFGVTALGFGIGAAYMATAGALGGLYAALIFAIAFLVLALITWAVIKIGEGQHQAKKFSRKKSSETGALVTTAALTALPILLKSPLVRTLGLPAAAVAGYLFVRNADKRD
jgi:uncharacterized membrane protein